MSVPDWLDSAAGFATCSILSSAGSALVGTGVATLAAGGGGIVPLTLGSLSLLAAGAACQPTAVDGKPSLADGCIEMSPGGYGVFQYSWEGFDWTDCGGQLGCSETTAITSTEVVQDQGTGQWLARAAFTSTQGSDVWQLSFDNEALATRLGFVFVLLLALALILPALSIRQIFTIQLSTQIQQLAVLTT